VNSLNSSLAYVLFANGRIFVVGLEQMAHCSLIHSVKSGLASVKSGISELRKLSSSKLPDKEFLEGAR
jgi:hypothetical protein